MHQILVYADSLSWGIVPNSRNRFEFSERWPGVMENALNRGDSNNLGDSSVRVIEDCLNGRRTVWDDPFKPGRNGLVGLEQRIEINSPLSLVMMLLGTNDFQSVHSLSAKDSSLGVAALVDAIRRAPVEPGMPTPRIMIIAPPPIRAADGPLASKFVDAEEKSIGLSTAFRSVALEKNCDFFDAAEVTTTSKVDGVHLDKVQHHELGMALAENVASILFSGDDRS